MNSGKLFSNDSKILYAYIHICICCRKHIKQEIQRDGVENEPDIYKNIIICIRKLFVLDIFHIF